MGGKRGQITVFIVIGIFVLASTAVYLYLRKEKFTEVVPETIPPEFQPVKEYVDQCLSQTTIQAVLRLGAQGGYLNLPPQIKNNPLSSIALDKGADVVIPYWYYNGQDRRPTLQDMEKDMAGYINSGMKDCLQDFAPFKDSFDIREIETPTTKVTIAEKEVVLTTTYPLLVKKKGESASVRMSQFTASVDVQLKKMYRLASQILDTENQLQFLEDLTLDLMTAGTDIPFSGITFDCGRLRWRVSEIQQKLKDLLYYNLPRIRFKNTKFIPFQQPLKEYEQFKGLTPQDVEQGNYPKNAPPDLYDYFHFFFTPTTEDYSDLTTGVFYLPDWRLNLAVHPSEGDQLEASFGKGEQRFLKFICLNLYKFTYNVQYPVEVAVTDDNGLDGKGFTFRYAFPVVITQNKPDRTSAGVPLLDLPEKGNDYCDAKTDEEYAIYARDRAGMFDLEGVNLTFSCMDRYSCELGTTGSAGNVNALMVHLPSFCKPGTLLATKEGYVDEQVDMPDTTTVDVLMTPLKDLSFRVVKQRMQGGKLLEPEFLEDGETAIVALTAKEKPMYAMYRKYPADNDTPDYDKLQLMVESTQYDVEVTLFDANDNLEGGFQAAWDVSQQDAEGADEAIFTAIQPDTPLSEDNQYKIFEAISDPGITARAMPVVK